MKYEPLPHQIEKSKECLKMIEEKGMALLAGEARSGKTFTAILVAEQLEDVKNVLVLTKKNAISGFKKFISDDLRCTYHITNYEQAKKLKKDDYDFIILDESHSLGAFPKPSLRTKAIRELAYDKRVILLSGTAIVESPSGIFHQCFITKYNPFDFKNFYAFHKEWGIPASQFIAGRELKLYNKTKPELIDEINKFSVFMTQSDAGINLQAVDELHYIDLDDRTKKMYNHLQKNKIIKFYDVNNEVIELICDSTMKLRTSLHSLEGGTIKMNDKYYEVGNLEKIEYIKKHFGDTEDISIMSHFVHERELLKKHFKNAVIYSSNANAEGVDLSHSKYFIIYSSDYSGAKHIQRRERIININGSNTLKVIFLLVKGAISQQVYAATSKKLDFNNAMFKRVELS